MLQKGICLQEGFTMGSRYKWLLFMLLLGVLGVIGVASDGYAEETVELVFWHQESPAHRIAAFQRVIDLFEEDHPNITVRQEVVSWGVVWPKTLAAFKAGTTPDFHFDIPDLNLFIQKAGGLVPVTDLVNELEARYDFFDSNTAMYRHGGEYWGVPIFTMVFNWIYRPSILKRYLGTARPPRTWEEAIEFARKLTVDRDGDGVIDMYGIGLPASLSLVTQQFIWAIMSTYGVRIYDEEGDVAFDSPEAVRALETFARLWEYAPAAGTGWAWGELEKNFAAGKFAMMPYFPSIQKRLWLEGDLDFGVAPMPLPCWPEGHRATIIYPNAVMIHRTAEERGVVEEVHKFIRFILRPEVNAMLTAGMEPGAFLPVTEAAARHPAYWEHEIIAAFPWQNEIALREVPFGNLYGFTWGRVMNKGIAAAIGANILAEVVQRVVILGESPEEAIRWGAQKIAELSEDLRVPY